MTTAPTYRSRQTGPDSWEIYDVPVFSAHERTSASGKLYKFDEAWLKGAVAKAQTRHAEGYFHPAHTRHHSAVDPSKRDDSDVRPAGRIRFRRVGALRMGGVDVPTIFADLVEVPGEVFAEIQAGRLPYRSVEVLSPSSGEIDSLAFLDHEVPFFRYPLLRVAAEAGTEITTHSPVAASAALAYRAAGDAHAALFSYAETTTMDPNTTKPEDEPQASADGSPIAKLKAALTTALQVLESMEAPAGEPVAPAPDATPPAGPVEMSAPAGGGRSYSAAPIRVVAPATRAADPLPTATRAAEVDGTLAGYAARLEAMQARLDEQDRRARVDARAAELRDRGAPANVVDDFRRRAMENEAAGMAYAAAVEKLGPVAPPSTWTGDQPPRVDAPEVMAYAAKGPEALHRARQLAASHERSGSTASLDTFIRANWAD